MSHQYAQNFTTPFYPQGSIFHCSLLAFCFSTSPLMLPPSLFLPSHSLDFCLTLIWCFLLLPPAGPAVSVPGGLAPALPGDRAGQRVGQQHLPEKSGPQWKQHGRHRGQDAQQSPADQHDAQVKETTWREGLLMCFCCCCFTLFTI